MLLQTLMMIFDIPTLYWLALLLWTNQDNTIVNVWTHLETTEGNKVTA